MDWLSSFKKPDGWLAMLVVVTAGLHLVILDQSDQPNLMSISILLWLAIASLLWDKRDSLTLKSGVFSTFLGATLMVIVLLRALSPEGYHLRFSPLISGVGLCLMASGIKGLREYWKELLVLTLLAFYSILGNVLQAINLPILTAKVSAFGLWATGFNAYRDGVFINLPTGRVEVYGSCSGVDSILLMVYVSILFFLIVPVSRLQQIICLLIAALIGFLINGLRVTLLALLVSISHQEAFDYWHGQDGSLIFSMVSVLIFGLFCWFTYVRNLTLTPETEE